jgi:O-methyltransferase/methyltransferase family protein
MLDRLAFRPLLRVLCGAGRTGSWADLKLLLRQRFFPHRTAIAKVEGPSPPLLFQMASAYWVSQAIYVAAKLGIADLLKDGPQACSELALVVGSDAASLRRLMRALSSIGIFFQADQDCFALSPLAESLRSDIPGSLRAIVITLGEIHYQACGALLHGVQTGSPSFRKVFGTSLFEYLSENPDAADAFNQGMANVAAMLAYAVLFAYDFADISSIVDVGGGEGRFLRKILDFYPKMHGTVFDTMLTIDKARKRTEGQTRRSRCSYVAGDFFHSVPEARDAYILSGVVHDWDDEHAVAILRNCRRAMTRNGRLLLLETVVPANNSMHFSKILDLNMLAMSAGRERTEAEFSTLLGVADYKLTKILPTMAPQSLIVAIPR